jgi:hypothetical protein
MCAMLVFRELFCIVPEKIESIAKASNSWNIIACQHICISYYKQMQRAINSLQRFLHIATDCRALLSLISLTWRWDKHACSGDKYFHYIKLQKLTSYSKQNLQLGYNFLMCKILKREECSVSSTWLVPAQPNHLGYGPIPQELHRIFTRKTRGVAALSGWMGHC